MQWSTFAESLRNTAVENVQALTMLSKSITVIWDVVSILRDSHHLYPDSRGSGSSEKLAPVYQNKWPHKPEHRTLVYRKF